MSLSARFAGDVTRGRHVHVAVLGLLALALLCRLPAVLSSPVDFNPTRQLRGAILARGFETRLNPPRDPALAAVARSGATDQGLLEPPVLDALTGATWAVAGERMWLPRLFAALGYLSGGVGLWLLGDRLVGRKCAWTALAYYSFAGYGLVATTSFQPDPWLIAGTCFAVLASVAWFEQPGRKTRAVALATGAVTIFVKPVAAPVVLGGLVGASLHRAQLDRRPGIGDTAWMAAVCVAPGALFLGVGISAGYIPTGQATSSFIPSMITTSGFWRGWLTEIGIVVTVPLFLVAAVAFIALAPTTAKRVGLGWLAGYVIFGLMVDYRISTHDYYSMPLLPIVALGLGIAVSALLARVPKYAWVVVLSLLTLLTPGVIKEWRDESAVQRESKSLVAEYENMGQAIGHHSVVILSGDYGGSFAFYGRVRTVAWPTTSDLNLERLSGEPSQSAAQRLAVLRAAIHADVFVVTRLPELDAQPEIRAILESERVLYRSNDAVMYQLSTV